MNIQTEWRYTTNRPVELLEVCTDWSYLASLSKVVAINTSDGQQLWSISTEEAVREIAATSKYLILLTHDRGSSHVYCIDRFSGSLVWQCSLPHGVIFGQLRASDDLIVVGGWRGYSSVTCLDVERGVVKWAYENSSGSTYTTALVQAGLRSAICVAHGNQIVIIDDRSGNVFRSFDLPKHECLRPIDLLIGEGSGSVRGLRNKWVLRGIRAMYLFEPSTDYLVEVNVDEMIGPFHPKIIENKILYVNQTNTLKSYDLKSRQCHDLGAVEHGVPDFLPAALSDCFICIGTYTGLLCVFTRDGKPIKKFKVGKHIYTDLTASGTNLIFGVGRSLVCCKLVV